MPLSLDEMVAKMKKSVELPDGVYPMMLLFALHTRLKGILPVDLCAYIAFIGRTSQGKSLAAEYTCEVCRGEWVTDASEAFIMAVLDGENSTTLGIDQLDDQLARNPNLNGIIETTNKWTAKRGVMVNNGKNKWTKHRVECGGPKIFSAIALGKRTLRNRCYEVQSISGKDPIELFARFALRHQDVADINTALDEYADIIRKANFDVAGRLLDPVHHAILRPLVHPGIEGRRLALAHIFELTNWMVGWGVDVIAALDYEVVDDEEDMFKAVLYELAIEKGWKNTASMDATAILSFVNERYKAIGIPTLNPTNFGLMMGKAGIEKKRSANHNVYAFTPENLALLNDSPVAPATKQTTVIWGTGGLKSV